MLLLRNALRAASTADAAATDVAVSTCFGAPDGPAAPDDGLVEQALPPPATGSRRRRVWELPVHCHCPLVGVCVPLPVADRLVRKTLGDVTPRSDYDIHVALVHACRQRSALSEALQRELDARHAAAIRRFAALKSSDALLQMFVEAVRAGGASGALWAALSHPRGDEVQEDIYRATHMHQHLAGASACTDRGELARLSGEHAVQAHEIRRLRQESRHLQHDKAAQAERFEALLVRARAEAIGRESALAASRAELEALRQSIPELPSRSALAQRVGDLGDRNRELARQLSDFRQQLAAARAPHGEADPAAPPVEAPRSEPRSVALALAAKAVLCVGGRPRAVALYRNLVERCGARFLHHDGGVEDNPHALGSSLDAADVVVCQAGCVSHNAYAVVKAHCKRAGKRCIYLDKPSLASFAQQLQGTPC